MKKLVTKTRKSVLFLKFDLKMKLSTLFLFLTIFTVQANDSFSQKVKISLDLHEVPIERLLDEIQSRTDFKFVYKTKAVNLTRIVSVKAKKEKVTTILDHIFEDTNTTYSIIDKQIFLVKKKKNRHDPPKNQQEVRGTVTNQNNLPIPGVAVVLKGTNTGTLTNMDGEYSIEAMATDTLIFSYMGYKTIEIPINGSSEINVQLEEDISALQAIEINAGYYTTTERESTGSIEKVTAKEIELQPVTNPLQALQGRMPGVEVVQQSGVPGLAASIQIRGQNSLRYNGNLPLYIVNGVPINSSPIWTSGLLTNIPGLGPLNALNIANIESIEVLKDADATAIYGSRGANGVVLITTKRGEDQNGKLKVNARLYSGISEASNKMELLNTQQYLAMRKKAFANDGVEPTLQNAPDLTRWDQNRYTDWQEKLFGGVAERTNMNLSLSWGNQQTSFVLGGSYHKEGSVFPGDFGYQKTTANINLNHQSKDKRFSLNFSTNYGVIKNKLFNNSFVNLALSLPPNAPKLYDDKGKLNWEDGTWINPFAALFEAQEVNTNTLLTNMNLKYNIWQGFSVKANLGYSYLINAELIKSPKRVYNPIYWDNVNASSLHNNVERSSWIIEPQLTYNTNIGKLNVEALAGLTFQNSSNNMLSHVGQGYSHESLIGNLAAANQVLIGDHENIEYRYTAIFGRLGLNWKEKYYLNLTGRRDGSSRFGENKRFANFGAVGAAWLFSEENLIQKHLPWLNFGKLRGSYGSTGSDQIPDYGYLDTYEPTWGPGGLYPTKLTNPDYSWEINKKLEAALELGMFKNHFQLEVAWYRNRSSNQLVGYPLPAITGFSVVQANLPAVVQNTGWEFSLTTINLKSTRVKWRTDVNLTLPKNKLVKFENLEETSYQNTYRVGKPLDIVLLYQYEGIDPETGLYQVADINGDGAFNYDDRIIVKNMGREFYGGINNSFTYKNIDLQFLLEYVRQNNYTYFTRSGMPGLDKNQPVGVLDAWQEPGDDTNTQKFSQDIPAYRVYSYARTSERAVGDASFLRLKTLTLSYNFSQSLMEKIKMDNIRLFLHGQNLFTLTDYVGLDPQGGLALPPMRTITGGVQVKF